MAPYHFWLSHKLTNTIKEKRFIPRENIMQNAIAQEFSTATEVFRQCFYMYTLKERNALSQWSTLKRMEFQI